jgi:hypothetical protein
MNDPDGMVQTIREQEKHIADLELRLKLRDKRILWWQGMASDLYDELIGFYRPETDPFGSITATVNDSRRRHSMNLSDYVDVPTRFAALLAKWPELRIKEHRPEIVTIGDKIFISVTMQAWRTPDDPQPCQATCFEPFPGKTPFTRDSEQMNASTSCLGRLQGS